MLVTIATLYEDDGSYFYSTVITGKVSDTERHALAKRFDAVYGRDPTDNEEQRSFYFSEVETSDRAALVTTMPETYGTDASDPMQLWEHREIDPTTT